MKIYEELEQGSDEWIAARCGILTASEFKLIITPTFKVAKNDKSRAHAYELAAQRVTRHVEPSYISDDMLRGQQCEILARDLYSEHYAPVREVGFITNDKHGFTMGYSPDGLVGDDGLIEIKAPRQKTHLKTIAEDSVPDEHMVQLQAGLLISGRKWIDFISYCGGMPMYVRRVMPDMDIQLKLIEAAQGFEESVENLVQEYNKNIDGLVETQRLEDQDNVISLV